MASETQRAPMLPNSFFKVILRTNLQTVILHKICRCELYSKGERSLPRTSSLNQPNETRAREVACNFISCNPFFTIVITPSHVMEYRMNVPDLEGIIEKKEYMVLQRGERSWRVRMLFNNARYRFGAGIRLFLTENELKERDICIFELINKDNCIFKVYVFSRDN
ncbi:hypothetical protein V8G54_037292 [Vigna mungo]|uniref:TF-B3 domain-containing protein n=1 Tax=Vigna mungo TaxID=3915 RepID=A0AAQ3MJA7_VIGMU